MQEVEGSTSHRGHMSEQFFGSSRPGYLHPVSSELENSGIRVVVGDCSVTERWRWCPPYQTGKTVHMHAKTLQTQRGRMHCAGCVRQWFRFHTTEPLGERRYENWNTHVRDTGGYGAQIASDSQMGNPLKGAVSFHMPVSTVPMAIKLW